MTKHRVLFYYHTNVEVVVETPDNATENEIIDAARSKAECGDYTDQIMEGLVEDNSPDVME